MELDALDMDHGNANKAAMPEKSDIHQIRREAMKVRTAIINAVDLPEENKQAIREKLENSDKNLEAIKEVGLEINRIRKYVSEINKNRETAFNNEAADEYIKAFMEQTPEEQKHWEKALTKDITDRIKKYEALTEEMPDIDVRQYRRHEVSEMLERIGKDKKETEKDYSEMQKKHELSKHIGEKDKKAALDYIKGLKTLEEKQKALDMLKKNQFKDVKEEISDPFEESLTKIQEIQPSPFMKSLIKTFQNEFYTAKTFQERSEVAKRANKILKKLETEKTEKKELTSKYTQNLDTDLKDGYIGKKSHSLALKLWRKKDLKNITEILNKKYSKDKSRRVSLYKKFEKLLTKLPANEREIDLQNFKELSHRRRKEKYNEVVRKINEQSPNNEATIEEIKTESTQSTESNENPTKPNEKQSESNIENIEELEYTSEEISLANQAIESTMTKEHVLRIRKRNTIHKIFVNAVRRSEERNLGAIKAENKTTDLNQKEKEQAQEVFKKSKGYRMLTKEEEGGELVNKGVTWIHEKGPRDIEKKEAKWEKMAAKIDQDEKVKIRGANDIQFYNDQDKCVSGIQAEQQLGERERELQELIASIAAQQLTPANDNAETSPEKYKELLRSIVKEKDLSVKLMNAA